MRIIDWSRNYLNVNNLRIALDGWHEACTESAQYIGCARRVLRRLVNRTIVEMNFLKSVEIRMAVSLDLREAASIVVNYSVLVGGLE